MNGYRLQLASDLDRDGMGFELKAADGEILAEVFEFDATKQRVFNVPERLSVDLEVLRWFLKRADEEL